MCAAAAAGQQAVEKDFHGLLRARILESSFGYFLNTLLVDAAHELQNVVAGDVSAARGPGA
jgi:hypothetical protein